MPHIIPFKAWKYFNVVARKAECCNYLCYHQITKVKVQQNVNKFNKLNIAEGAPLSLSRIWIWHKSASKSDWFAERATRMSVNKIYKNPQAGCLKASDLCGNKFVWEKKRKKKKKRWQIKACKCSYFLYTTRQKELMSHCAVPQITPREKNSSPQTAECGGSSPSGGVVLRLIGLCGIQWTWLRPSTRRARRPPHWRNADTLGEYSSTAIFVVFLLAPFLEVSLPAQLQMAFTLQRHASLVPTLVAYSKSAGIIYSITIFRFSQSQI